MVTFTDCQCFAGGLTLGGVQAGMTLVGKLEDEGGFGVRNCEANRKLLGDNWESQVGAPSTWEPIDSDVILSNPPCSGFSSMSWGKNRKTYGINAKVNQCMWNLIGYAGKVNPQVLVMESVQAAAVTGMPLMRNLRAKLEELTGEQYWLYHVLQNNGALGGASIRRRYFMVLSRIPFGVEKPDYGPPPTLREVIGDLQALDPHTFAPQRYVSEPSPWLFDSGMLNPAGVVDGHATSCDTTPGMNRLKDLWAGDREDLKIWPQNRCLAWALRTYYEAYGALPASWRYKSRDGGWSDENLIAKNFEMGFTRPKRWVYDLPARVIIGGAMYLVLHPEQDRMLTHRECARIMGFPDSWVAEPLEGMRGLEETWGKGVSVPSGRWIARWAKDAVNGVPGSEIGVPVGEHHRLSGHGSTDRETVIDVSRVPKREYLVKTVAGEVVPNPFYATLPSEDIGDEELAA